MRQAPESVEDGGGARRGPVVARAANPSHEQFANPFAAPDDQPPCTRTGRAVSCPDLGGTEVSVGRPPVLIGGVELPDVEVRGAAVDGISSTLQRVRQETNTRARQETYTKRSGLRHRLWMRAYLQLQKL